ncbi:hypothetical protein [Streptomyces sp. ST1015]|uniref:hypothetical protein n=1 Tax=Streptomyces sp. ST1015 TaxID=1848900 RepID=UPI00223B4812|nr:hypothetical protein [Streptomyces sp. ST1015]
MRADEVEQGPERGPPDPGTLNRPLDSTRTACRSIPNCPRTNRIPCDSPAPTAPARAMARRTMTTVAPATAPSATSGLRSSFPPPSASPAAPATPPGDGEGGAEGAGRGFSGLRRRPGRQGFRPGRHGFRTRADFRPGSSR